MPSCCGLYHSNVLTLQRVCFPRAETSVVWQTQTCPDCTCCSGSNLTAPLWCSSMTALSRWTHAQNLVPTDNSNKTTTKLTQTVLFLKVNFYHDHTKIILCCQRDEYMLTYINEDRVSKTFRLSSLLTSGCPADLRERMVYSLNMLLQRCS